MKYLQVIVVVVFALCAVACGRQGANEDQSRNAAASTPPALIIAAGPDLIAAETIAAFERSAGIKVESRIFPSQEEVEARVLAGNSGFDLVVLGASFLERQIDAGLFRQLDRKQLTNLANIDATFQKQAAAHDPGNALGVAFLWRALGVGVNEQKIREAWPEAGAPDWNFIFDQQVAARLQSCGIAMTDSPMEVMQAMLRWMGRDPLSPQSYDVAELRANLTALKPFVRVRPPAEIATALARGELCAAMLWTANARQEDAAIRFVVPQSGSVIDFEMLAIPADAAHAANAHGFINHLLDRKVAVGNASAVRRSTTLTAAAFSTDAVEAGPDNGNFNSFAPALAPDVGVARELNEAWAEFATR